MGVGEGNGTPLQYTCLENPMDGGAWQALNNKEKLSKLLENLNIKTRDFFLINRNTEEQIKTDTLKKIRSQHIHKNRRQLKHKYTEL